MPSVFLVLWSASLIGTHFVIVRARLVTNLRRRDATPSSPSLGGLSRSRAIASACDMQAATSWVVQALTIPS